MGKLVALFVYLCVGTMIAQGICLTYAWSKGYVSNEKLHKMFVAAQSGDNAKKSNDEKAKEATSEQPSFDDIERARALQTRNLELREQSLQAGLERVRYEQSKLVAEKETYRRIREAFDAYLKSTKEGLIAKGRTEVRTILENVKPKQAKQQILEMIEAGEEAEVVAILSEMSVAKRAKICAEFSKSEEDIKKMDELLRLIRQGIPETTQIDNTQNELDATQADES